MGKAVFLDRDGTIAKDVNYCRRVEDFELLPNAREGIKLLNDNGFKILVITNQSGIARGYFTEKNLAEIHGKMMHELGDVGARVDAIYYCPHHPKDNCECRKPNPKLAHQAIKEYDIDCKHSYVIGDRLMDIQLGRNIGCKTIIIDNERCRKELKDSLVYPDFVASDLVVAGRWIIAQSNTIKETCNY